MSVGAELRVTRTLDTKNDQHPHIGLIYGLGAYGLWGIVPLYFRLLRFLPPAEVLAHRIVWSFVVLSLLTALTRRWRDVGRALRSPRVMLALTASTLLIAANWFTYIYSVTVDRVLEASLGYFITPLVNVLLGMIFLGERLRPLQVLSILLACGGIAVFATMGQDVPWLALLLAFTFAFYGLLRKTTAANATTGLYIETLLLAPLALLLLIVLQSWGAAESTTVSAGIWSLLVLSGLITTIPLLLFAGAARRLSMATLGFLQYLSPTLQFIVAVLIFHEPFTRVRLIGFAAIWIAVAIYSFDSLLTYRAGRGTSAQLAADAPTKM